MESSAYKSHLPLAIVTVVLVIAMILLFKEVGALKTSVATVSTSLQNLSAADPVVTFVPVPTNNDAHNEEEEGPELPRIKSALVEELPAPSSTKKKAQTSAAR